MPKWKDFCRLRELKISLPADAQNLLDFQTRRLGLPLQAFHIFLLGGTGGGKSSFFNLLAGEKLVAESPVRPCSNRISVYLPSQFANELKDLAVDCYYHERADFSQLVLWDFPDFDSYQFAHHELAVFFREYADIIFLILHPEKLHQQNCRNFLRHYPQIPVLRWITHAKDLSAKEERELKIHCQTQTDWQGDFFLIDLVQDREMAEQKIMISIATWTDDTIKQRKIETAQKLTQEAVALLSPILIECQVEQEKLAARQANLQLQEHSFWPRLWVRVSELYECRIFAKIALRLRYNLLLTDWSYFADIYRYFRSKHSAETPEDNFPLALPYLLWEEGFSLSVGRERFLLAQESFIADLQDKLLFNSLQNSFWRRFCSIFFDYLSILPLAYVIFSQPFALATTVGLLLHLLLFLFCILFLALFFLWRTEKSYQILFRQGYRIYYQWLEDFFSTEVEQKKKGFSDSLVALGHDIEIIDKICR